MNNTAYYTRPWLYPKQHDAIFNSSRYAVIEATTKAGKTVGCLAWLSEQAILYGKPGRNYWWVAPIYAQAKIAYRRLKRALPLQLYVSNETELTITLLNGAVIWFKGAEHPDSLYGEDVYAAVIDEATRVKEQSWHAVRTTMTATRGPIRIIGNVKGRKNWAYRLARMAEAGETNMYYARITAWDAVDAGILAREEIEDARRLLPAHVFKELYEAVPADDAGNPFGLDAINKCIIPDYSSDPTTAYGADLAKSYDWTVVLGLSGNGAATALHRWQAPWQETTNEIIAIIGSTPTLIDSTGVGDPVVETIQRRNEWGNVEGFKFSSTSKQQLMEDLASAIRSQELTFPDGPIRAELETFEYTYTRTGVLYSAPEGYHDDIVMALALARRQWKAIAYAPPILIGRA